METIFFVAILDSFGLPQESPKKSKLRQEVGR
jgi:hypothetical protein